MLCCKNSEVNYFKCKKNAPEHAILRSIKLETFNFYRATRMHSADHAMARCLSVCLSHAGIGSKRL